jgi:beta-1,4-galactosyltransferase 1
MFIFLVAYRARGLQKFRRDQLSSLIENIDTYFNKNNIQYKIFICEQNDDDKFNRGKLLNIAFLESEKLFNFSKKYFHMNTDYLFDLNRNFPAEILNLTTGVIDLHKPPFNVLGAACVFDPETYNIINGFPNDLLGWGGDDWAIYNRLIKKNVSIFYPKNLTNSGFIIENNDDKIYTDISNNIKNMNLAKRDDINTNGLSSCIYKINSKGEFHNENNIYHYLFDL